MSQYWGVNCSTCGEFINLDKQDHEETVMVYLPPLVAVPCSCGSSHLYGTRDVVDEAGVFLNPWPE